MPACMYINPHERQQWRRPTEHPMQTQDLNLTNDRHECGLLCIELSVHLFQFQIFLLASFLYKKNMQPLLC